MNSWKVYELNTAPVSGNEVGNLAPSTFGGLSYLIIGNPSTDIYTIRTESFGTANIFAPRDDDSSITNVAQFNNESNSTGSGDYLNLQPHMTSWRVYPVGKSPVSGNEAGRLAPAVFGGLSYRIIDEPSPNLYTIETESFGRVNIYAPRDQDSTITNSPEFSNGGDRGSSGSGAGQFLNLEPHEYCIVKEPPERTFEPPSAENKATQCMTRSHLSLAASMAPKKGFYSPLDDLLARLLLHHEEPISPWRSRIDISPSTIM